MRERHDVAVVGGGPAGMAVAIEAALRGFSTVVLERRPGPPDKACGEGILPGGVRRLEALGVRIDPRGCSPFSGIQYVQESGPVLEARFSARALGVRRTALASALWERAAEVGVEIRAGCEVQGPGDRVEEGRTLRTKTGEVQARLVVAADGLHSPLRRAAGLEGTPRGPVRFGVRRHVRAQPPDFVEVHWRRGVEAYVTPVGPERVGIAFLLDARAGPASWPALLARFPALASRFGEAASDSEDRGAGPLAQEVRTTVAKGLVLVGDAAGYVDAITGEGISLAFEGAQILGETLAAALADDCSVEALEPYRLAHAALFHRYARIARGVLLLSRFPLLRRSVLAAAHVTRLFEPLVRSALGDDITRAAPTPTPSLPPAAPGR